MMMAYVFFTQKPNFKPVFCVSVDICFNAQIVLILQI